VAYYQTVEFIESHVFEKQVDALLSDDEFALLQGFLFSNPKAGAVIQETGGLRKVRWAIKGKGKSGGVRVIYFFVTAAAQIRLIAIYKKGVKDDLNAGEKKVLKKLNENW
jgi:mRNA-degrading endonuclease RelE of RelBE toxin-antitoxin system